MATPSYHDDTLLARWLSGELRPEEEAELRQRPEFKDYQRLLSNVDRLQPPAFDADAAYENLRKARSAPETPTLPLRPRPTRSLRLWYGAAAAVALLLTAWFLLRPTAENFTTGAGEDLLATRLSDNSSVRLNDATTFAFVPDDTTRRARLAGEAFFEVQKSAVPFVVDTELGQVTVVGTAFNVYSRRDSMSVYCTEGKVRVSFTGSTDEYVLTPGEAVSIDAGKRVSRQIGEVKESLDWLDNHSFFVNRPLEEILDELERQYDVIVERPASMDVRKKYNIEFPHDDLPQALKNTLTPANMTFTVAGNTVIPRPLN